MLTLKTCPVTLLTILSAQGIHTARLLHIRNMLVSDSIVSIGYKLKQTRPDYHLHELEFPAYTPDNELCPVSVVQEYLARMKPLYGNITSLFISFVKPYKQVAKSTISRWQNRLFCSLSASVSLLSSLPPPRSFTFTCAIFPAGPRYISSAVHRPWGG